ncbi:MAG: MOSC domain-containing protein [bacterium]
MTSSSLIHRISVSKVRGDKKNNVDEALLADDWGIVGDVHAGSERQVSLLPLESFAKLDSDLIDINPGDFAENLTTTGLDFIGVTVGNRLTVGEEITLEITQIGKECHRGCRILEIVGDCIMPREGLFAKVIRGGIIKTGDSIRWD